MYKAKRTKCSTSCVVCCCCCFIWSDASCFVDFEQVEQTRATGEKTFICMQWILFKNKIKWKEEKSSEMEWKSAKIVSIIQWNVLVCSSNIKFKRTVKIYIEQNWSKFVRHWKFQLLRRALLRVSIEIFNFHQFSIGFVQCKCSPFIQILFCLANRVSLLFRTIATDCKFRRMHNAHVFSLLGRWIPSPPAAPFNFSVCAVVVVLCHFQKSRQFFLF